MTWTAEHRRAADRRGLRYPSDMTDAEWALVQPMIRPARCGGLCCINVGGEVPRTTLMRPAQCPCSSAVDSQSR